MTGTTSRDAKRGAVAFRVLTAFVLLLLFTSSVGRAQVPGPLETDASCNPAAYDDMQQFQAEVCASHAGCALTLKIMRTSCKAKAFLGKIGNFFSPASSSAELTSEDVLEASLPNVPSTPITRRAISNARAAVTRRDPPQTSMSYNSASTTATYSEGSLTPNGQPDGPAVSLASNGVGSSGTWTNGRLNGPGLVKDSKDVVVAGYFRDSSLQGEGFRYAEDKVLIEGTYLNGQPDGMMNVVYADGATQKKLYKNGAILAEGPRAPKGQLAQDAVYRSPEMIAAEQEAAYSSKLKTATAGSLYAMADESLAGGDSEHGRRALRELLTRFPDSSLAAKAADRLASIGNTQQAAPNPPPAITQPAPRSVPKALQPGSFPSVADVNGIWRGDVTGGEFRMELLPEGISVSWIKWDSRAEFGAQIFKPAGPGEYHYVFPEEEGAALSILKFQQAGVLRITTLLGKAGLLVRDDVFRMIRTN